MPYRAWVVSADRVFETDFLLYAGGEEWDAYALYCRLNGSEPDDRPPHGESRPGKFGSCQARQGWRNFVVWLSDPGPAPCARWSSVLAHEAVHGAAHALRGRGFDVSTGDGEEALAYYAGFVVRECHERLWPVPGAEVAPYATGAETETPDPD